MISEEGYWKAKELIKQQENEYAHRAIKATDHDVSRNFWGHCDGMKLCLKILEENVEQGDSGPS